MSLLFAKQPNPREGGPSFSLKHRLFRLAWGMVWGVFGRLSPIPFHGWRRFLLRCFGAKISKSARVYPSVLIWYPPNLEMHEHSVMGPRVTCYCMDRVTLCSYAVVSQGAHLCAGTHSVDDEHFQLLTKPITIGKNAWVAAEAFVGPGVIVADGAVLGARGVSFRNLKALSIYAGNPARFIRLRKSGHE